MFDPLQKEMATHSSILAWRIPGTEEPGGLGQSMGSQRFGHDWTTKSSIVTHEENCMVLVKEITYCVPCLLIFAIFPLWNDMAELTHCKSGSCFGRLLSLFNLEILSNCDSAKEIGLKTGNYIKKKKSRWLWNLKPWLVIEETVLLMLWSIHDCI